MKILVILLVVFSFVASASELKYRTYKFAKLQKQLGYPSENYFGSSEDEISDLETYTSKEDTWYRDINTYLRKFPNINYEWDSVSPEDSKKIVESIDQIYTRIPNLPADLILFRGIDLKYRNSESFKKGDEFIEKGFASTSASFKVADYFANQINDNANTSSKKAILVLYSTKDANKGILIDQGEDEVLLTHGLKIKIMEVDKTNKYDLYLAQICSSTCEEQTNKSVNLEFKKLIKR